MFMPNNLESQLNKRYYWNKTLTFEVSVVCLYDFVWRVRSLANLFHLLEWLPNWLWNKLRFCGLKFLCYTQINIIRQNLWTLTLGRSIPNRHFCTQFRLDATHIHDSFDVKQLETVYNFRCFALYTVAGLIGRHITSLI